MYREIIQFVESISLDEKISISPNDIYNFYYLNYILTDRNEYNNLTDDEASSAEYEIKAIRDKYLKSFLIIVQSQLQKYLKLKRIDTNSFSSKDILSDNYEKLNSMMQKTYRSDMSRRNVNWNNLTTLLENLQKTNNLKDVMFLIDRINNTVHNTSESILTKFPNYKKLLSAFQDCHDLDPKQIKLKTSGLNFLNEAETDNEGKAYVFDVDDTLIKSGSKVKVLKNGRITKKLSPKEFNTYKRDSEEIYDFSEFDQIINPRKYKAWRALENINRKISQGKSNSTIYILTARSSGIVDALERFLTSNNITQINRDNIFAIGDKSGTKSVAEKKRDVLEQIKIKHDGQVTFFDDANDNIELAKTIGIKTRHIKESNDSDEIAGKDALGMAIGPMGMVGGKAFIWDKFNTDDFLIGSSVSGHTPLLTQLIKKVKETVKEDTTIRGYWIPKNKTLIIYSYVRFDKTRRPSEDDVEHITSKIGIIPANVLFVKDNYFEESDVVFEKDIKDEKKIIINKFITFVKSELNIKIPIKIILQGKRKGLKTTGAYDKQNGVLRINTKNRALVDVLRTIAHELVHHYQHENGQLKTNHPDIGGRIENEANYKAGIFIKLFAKRFDIDIYDDNISLMEDIQTIITKTMESLWKQRI